MAEALRRPLAVAPELTRPSVRVGALPTVPAHVGTMLGISVAGYGVALALVTVLQSSNEAALAANRAPMAATIDTIAAGNDRLSGALTDAAGRYARAADGYQAVADSLTGFEDGLGSLSTAVTAVDGAARALPGSVALPPVVRSVKTGTGTVSHATSGGSAAP